MSEGTDDDDESLMLSSPSVSSSEDEEAQQDIDWRKHPARAILKNAFESGDIPLDYKNSIKARASMINSKTRRPSTE